MLDADNASNPTALTLLAGSDDGIGPLIMWVPQRGDERNFISGDTPAGLALFHWDGRELYVACINEDGFEPDCS